MRYILEELAEKPVGIYTNITRSDVFRQLVTLRKERRVMTKWTCQQCGVCCVNNGLIPPLVPGEEKPEWFNCLVNRLRTAFGEVAEDYPCVFLTDEMGCAIYDPDRPRVCVSFHCRERE